jgi:hypothetical protein
MTGIVAGLRQRTDQPIQTVYSDIASNDFNRLFINLEDARRARRFGARVYPVALAGSFYGPLLAPGTVHLATCFNAIHWLDRLPAVLVHDAVVCRRPHPARPGLPVLPETVAAFTRQAEQDLACFLECRARELVPGAKLLVAGPGDTDQASISDGLNDLLNDACLDMVQAGGLHREEYERMTMPCYFRTVAELVAPLKGEGPPLGSAFTIDRAQSMEVPTPFFARFTRDGDVAAYAAAFTGFVRAITEPVFRAALNHRESEAATLECLYERIRARLLAEPERYSWRHLLVAVLLTRR